MKHLRVVECVPENNDFRVLLELEGVVRWTVARWGDVELPLIDLTLSAVYLPDDVIDTVELGPQMSVTTGILWRGQRRVITAVPTVLEDGLGLILPRAFFT